MYIQLKRPERQICKSHIYFVRAISDNEEKYSVCLPALSLEQAIFSFKMRYPDKKDWYLKASIATCDGHSITILHHIPQHAKFKIVDKNNLISTNEFLSEEKILTKSWSLSNRTYLCLGEDRKSYSVDADTWCICINEKISNPLPKTPPSTTPPEPPTKDIIIKYEDIDRVEVYKEPSFDYVMIKTTEAMMEERGGSLYESTRRYWKATKITGYTYVLSVVNQIVQSVYIANRWHLYMPGEDGCPTTSKRWGFEGVEAKGDEFEALIGKRIPEQYRKKGNVSPVLYKKD